MGPKFHNAARRSPHSFVNKEAGRLGYVGPLVICASVSKVRDICGTDTPSSFLTSFLSSIFKSNYF